MDLFWHLAEVCRAAENVLAGQPWWNNKREQHDEGQPCPQHAQMPAPVEVPQTATGMVRSVIWGETFSSSEDGQKMLLETWVQRKSVSTLLLYLHIAPGSGLVILFHRPPSRCTSEMQCICGTQHITESIDTGENEKIHINHLNGPNPTPIQVSGSRAIVHNETKNAVMIN